MTPEMVENICGTVIVCVIVIVGWIAAIKILK